MGEESLREDPLVQELAPDPAKVGHPTLLTGYLGRSPTRGKWRLYLSCQLCEYFEVDEADIMKHHQPGPGPDGLGGTALWIRPGASVRHVRTSSAEAQGEFLQGELASAHLPEAPIDVEMKFPQSVRIDVSRKATCTLRTGILLCTRPGDV